MKSMPYPSSGPAGRGQVGNRASSGANRISEPVEGVSFDPLVGRRVRTRWPDDNNFYEAVITDYNPVEVCMSPDYMQSYIALLSNILCLELFRDDMHWYMILVLARRHGNGLISQRYNLYQYHRQLFFCNLLKIWQVSPLNLLHSDITGAPFY